MDESRVSVLKDGGIAFVGADAVNLFRAKMLRSAIKMLAVGLKPTRGFTAKKALAMASEYTGKAYKRGQLAEARADVEVWIHAMESAIPVERK